MATAEAVARKRAGVKPSTRPGVDLGQNFAQGRRVNDQIAELAGVSNETAGWHALRYSRYSEGRAEAAMSSAARELH